MQEAASISTGEGGGSRMLGGLGLDDLEERAYLHLLRRSPATLRDHADATGVGLPQMRRTVASLEEKGLLSRAAGRAGRLMAARPDIAIDALIRRREEELQSAQLHAQQLLAQFWARPPGSNPVELVEVIVGREAVAQRVFHLLRSAKEEVLAFDKPPYTDSHTVGEGVESDSIRLGGVWRAIYDPSALEVPGVLESLRKMAAAGEQARVLHRLPMKLLIVDRQSGLIPLTVRAESALESAVEVHPSALLEALVALFENLWERATPVRSFHPRNHPAERAPALADADRMILTLLAAGLKDEAIARRTGVGVRTVRRRIQLLLARFGANTRFQAGLRVAEEMGLHGGTNKGPASLT